VPVVIFSSDLDQRMSIPETQVVSAMSISPFAVDVSSNSFISDINTRNLTNEGKIMQYQHWWENDLWCKLEIALSSHRHTYTPHTTIVAIKLPRYGIENIIIVVFFLFSVRITFSGLMRLWFAFLSLSSQLDREMGGWERSGGGLEHLNGLETN
jgi:hypothetical protein